MATSLAQLHKQIAKLEKQASALKKKEAVGVIARIKVAIAFYDLAPQDLGFAGGAKNMRKSNADSSSRSRGSKLKAGKYKTGIKYRDDDGNVWSGHGRRPKWFTDAIESGKTAEQLAA